MDREVDHDGPPHATLPRVRSLVAVCAHPDDESFGLGGTIARFAAEGAHVAVVCFTHGEASTLGAGGEALRHTRARELAAAGEVLGARRVALFDHPDSRLSEVPTTVLASEAAGVADEQQAELILAFDEGGVTAHPDHCRATEAALEAAGGLPVLAWTMAKPVADTLNEELGTAFVGRTREELDFAIAVDRDRQLEAIGCHTSQSSQNAVLWRRLELQGDREVLRWLRR